MLPLVEWRHRVLVLREWAPSLPVLSKLPDHVFVINSKIFWCGRLGELGELAVISGGRRLALLCSAATHPPPEVSTTNYYIMFGFFVFIALNSLQFARTIDPINCQVNLRSDLPISSLSSLPPSFIISFSLCPPLHYSVSRFCSFLFPLIIYRVYTSSLFFHRFFFTSSIFIRHCLFQFRVFRGKRQVNSTNYNLLWCSCCEHIALKRISRGARRTRYFCVGHLFATTDRSDTMRRDGYIRPE